MHSFVAEEYAHCGIIVDMVSITELSKIAAKEAGITVDDLRGPRRDRQFFIGRMIFAYLSRSEGYSYSAIGEELMRDHSTAMYTYRRAEKDAKVQEIVRLRLSQTGVIAQRSVGPKGRYARIYELYGGKCAVCGFDEIVEVHHIIPRALGGKDYPENLVLLCPNHHALVDRGMLLVKDINPGAGLCTPSTTTIR